MRNQARGFINENSTEREMTFKPRRRWNEITTRTTTITTRRGMNQKTAKSNAITISNEVNEPFFVLPPGANIYKIDRRMHAYIYMQIHIFLSPFIVSSAWPLHTSVDNDDGSTFSGISCSSYVDARIHTHSCVCMSSKCFFKNYSFD